MAWTVAMSHYLRSPRRAADRDGAETPLDRRLKAALRTLHAELETEPLPPALAELARQLETKLRRGGPGDDTDSD